MNEGTEKMSGMAYAGGMLFAAIIDIIGIVVPVLGTIFIGFMRLSFWLAGYDMRNTTGMTVTNALPESLPIVPCCMVFMWSSHRKNAINCKEREKEMENSQTQESYA